MSTINRLRRVVAVLQNMAERSLVKSMTAAHLDRLRRQEPGYPVEKVLAYISKDREKSQREIVDARSGVYSLDLKWMVERFVEISRIAARIDVEKVAELRRQRRSTSVVFENKLREILTLIVRPTSGVVACYRSYLSDPARLDTTVIAIVGDIYKDALGIRRVLTVLKLPLLRRLLIDFSPWLLALGAVGVFFVAYFAASFIASPAPVADASARVSSDLLRVREVWTVPDRTVWSRIGDTTSLLGQITTLAPLALVLAGLVLTPIRRLLFRTGRMSSTISTWQANIFSAAKQLHVSRAAIINVEEVNVTTVDHSTRIGDIGSNVILNIHGYMANVVAIVNGNIGAANQPDEIKSLVSELTAKLQEISPRIDPGRAKEMGRNLEALSKEMTLEKPRKAWYELSVSGLKEAAEALDQIGKPILNILGKLSPLLLGHA